MTDTGGHTFVHSGTLFPFDGFTEEHVLLEDIIHHLSLINRWNGGTDEPFSVLEHCMYCDDLLLHKHGKRCRPFWRVSTLLHDAHEAYTGDLPTDLKAQCPWIGEFQKRLDKVIFAKFGLEPPVGHIREKIREVDRLAMLGEAGCFLPKKVYHGLLNGISDPVWPELSPKQASYGENRERARNRFRNKLTMLLEQMDVLVEKNGCQIRY